MPSETQKSQWLPLLLGAVFGALYGVGLRLLLQGINPYAIMSLAFLVLGSIVLGFLSVVCASRRHPISVRNWILLPWLSIALACLVAMACYLEGSICVVFALPITLVSGSVGGVIAGFSLRQNTSFSRSTMTCITALPFVLALFESRLTSPREVRTVSSTILIHSSPDTVWKNIERVPAILPTELHPTWAQKIGFPRPVEATLSYEGVGGVRHASFERGLQFIETVTKWQPDHLLAFRIKADSEHIPPTTLDEHVTIGGRFFDVLDGEYRIEQLDNGNILLHLTSHQRLSTDFNPYAGVWSDAVMQSLQSSILQVIQHRCEQNA